MTLDKDVPVSTRNSLNFDERRKTIAKGRILAILFSCLVFLRITSALLYYCVFSFLSRL
jgi:hypothetical protein